MPATDVIWLSLRHTLIACNYHTKTIVQNLTDGCGYVVMWLCGHRGDRGDSNAMSCNTKKVHIKYTCVVSMYACIFSTEILLNISLRVSIKKDKCGNNKKKKKNIINLLNCYEVIIFATTTALNNA